MLTASITAAANISVESLISDLAFILILGAVTTLFFKWIKQPVVLGYIVAGFLASPHFEYLPSVTTEANIDFWAQIGIIVLLFSLGLEFSFKKLLNAGGSAVVTALVIVCGMMIAGFTIGHLLGFSRINSLFLGGMLSMSSTTIIIKAFNDLGLTQRKFASLVFAVLIVEDLFAVVMMVILSSIAINNSVEGSEMLYSIMKLGFFLIMWFAVGVFLIPTFLNGTRRFLNDETLLIVAMGMCLGMAVFSVYCGFSMALGAFVMGSILAGTSFAEKIEHVTVPIKDLFGSVFFISVGMMVDPTIIAQYWVPILILSAVVIVGMIVFGTFGMLITGQTLRIAIESGFSLTQIGEFAFIIASLGMSLGVLDPTIYPIVVAVSVLTTFTTPYFIRMADPFYSIVEKHLPSSLQFLITRYSKQACEESETALLWRTVLRRYLWRIVLYSVILITICIITQRWLLPVMTSLMHGWGRFVTAVITIAAMAPFLLALSLPASRRTERSRLISANARFDVPLIVMTIFRLLLSLSFLVYILSAIYTWSVGVTVAIAFFLIFIFMISKNVKKRMAGIEKKFLNNLNERELRRSGRNNNVISDLHLAFMTVGYGCPFLGRRLDESEIARKYGASVASIQRGDITIPVPGGNERIFPGDVIGVIGTDYQIQELLSQVEKPSDIKETVNTSDMKLTSLHLTETSPLIGKTLAQSHIRDKFHSLMVGVNRDDKFLNPTADLKFQTDDIVWLVGNPAELVPLKG